MAIMAVSAVCSIANLFMIGVSLQSAVLYCLFLYFLTLTVLSRMIPASCCYGIDLCTSGGHNHLCLDKKEKKPSDMNWTRSGLLQMGSWQVRGKYIGNTKGKGTPFLPQLSVLVSHIHDVSSKMVVWVHKSTKSDNVTVLLHTFPIALEGTPLL